MLCLFVPLHIGSPTGTVFTPGTSESFLGMTVVNMPQIRCLAIINFITLLAFETCNSIHGAVETGKTIHSLYVKVYGL